MLIKAAFLTIVILSASAFAMTKGKLSTDTRYSAVRSYAMLANGMMGSCTGAFITKRHMLTAAHCMEYVTKNASPSLFVGQFPNNVEKGLSFYNRVISYRVYVHPSFLQHGVMGDSSDAAVLEFSSDMSDAVIPVDSTPVVKNERLTTTGYGCDKSTNIRGNDFQIGEELVASISDRRVFLKKIETVMCPGDSGGPVLRIAPDQSLSIVGINSYYHPIGRLLGKSADRVTRLDDGSRGSIRQWLNGITSGQIKPNYEL